MKDEKPITFEEPSYALFDVTKNSVLTTEHGNLTIFSVRGMAEVYARNSSRNIAVVAVQISRITAQ